MAGCAGGELLSGEGLFYSCQGWREQQGLCAWLSDYPARSRSGSLFLPPTQPRPGTPQNSRTLASITAEKKVPKSSAGWRQGTRIERRWLRAETRGAPPLAHRAPRQPIPSAPRWATHVAHFDPTEPLQQPPFDRRPQRAGYIEAGAGRALLAAVLEGRAQGAAHHAVHVGRAVHEVEVLAPALYGAGREGACVRPAPGPNTRPAPAHRVPRPAPGMGGEAVRNRATWTLTSQACPPTLQTGRRRPRHGQRAPGGVGTSFPTSQTRKLSLGVGMLPNINKAEEGPEPKAPRSLATPGSGCSFL